MEEFKKKFDPILEEHLELDHKCAEDYYYDFDSHERNIIWEKEKKALSGAKFEDIITYIDNIDSAEKLGALSEAFFEEFSHEAFGDKRREVLECFKRNNERLTANLDEFLSETEKEL